MATAALHTPSAERIYFIWVGLSNSRLVFETIFETQPLRCLIWTLGVKMDRKETKTDLKTAVHRIGKSTFQLLLIDLPIIGWLFVAYFAWSESRIRRKKDLKN